MPWAVPLAPMRASQVKPLWRWAEMDDWISGAKAADPAGRNAT